MANDAVKARIFLVSVFVAMLLGMIGKAFYDHLTKSSRFDFAQIAIPLIVSPMVYGVFFSVIKTTDTVPALILAFQNGFFWQDIFSSIKPAVAG